MSDLCDEIEKFGKGIGNASRYRIVEALFSGEKTVSRLVSQTKFSQSLVSQHLRILKETGIVQDRRQGKEVFYALNNQYVIGLLTKLTKELKPHEKKRKT